MAQINKPTDYFNTVLYTGDGTNSRAVTGTGFQADFVWLKDRGTKGGSTNYHHQTWDSVRGASDGTLYTSLTNAVDTSYPLTSFDSDGITLRPTSHNSQNETGEQYVLWSWLASNTTASNTDGSITSTVSANTTSGFSIVSYTGTGANATVGHGLGSKPKFIIIKSRDKVDNWHCYHESIGATKVIWLDLTSASASTSTFMQDTEPTSSVFSLGTNTAVNTSGFDHIAYCFAEKKGFSKFGSYTGNGSTDGTFVYTGFKPAFFICKRTNASDDWFVFDNKREGYNVDNDELRPNTSAIEGTTDRIDILSNGIKHRNSGSAQNGSGSTYIYMAFAESPLVGTNNTPATAR